MADDFDTILDRCLAEVTAGRSIEACLKHYPQQASQLEPLLKMASRVRAFPPVVDLPQARARVLELRLLDRAAQLPRPQVHSTPRRAPVWRWLPVAMIFLVLCSFASFRVTSASANSLPGEVLYPVKRFSEGVAGVLTPATSQADLHVALAQRRLTEFLTLADRNDVRQDLLLERSSEMVLALSTAENAAELDQATVFQRVATAAEQQAQQLSVALVSAPEVSRGSLEMALAATTTEHDRAVELLAAKTPHAVPPGLTTTVTSTPAMSGTSAPTLTATMPVATPTPVFTVTDPAKDGSSPSVTPPGQGTPKPKVTPPGQGTPKPKVTPPGQGTPKPKETSSGEEDSESKGGGKKK